MSILSPDHEVIDAAKDVIDEVNDDYSNYLKHNEDYDNIDFLAELLIEKSVDINLDVDWVVSDDLRANPAEWISAMAGRTKTANFLKVYLWSDNLEGTWGPATFKETLIGMLGHETIHFAQFDRIDPSKFDSIESGHEKGKRLKAKTGKERDWQRLYFADPHELMAYGHDLASNIELSTDPEAALRSPEAFIDELPVYGMYRTIWPANAKPIKRLLSYAARYYETKLPETV